MNENLSESEKDRAMQLLAKLENELHESGTLWALTDAALIDMIVNSRKIVRQLAKLLRKPASE